MEFDYAKDHGGAEAKGFYSYIEGIKKSILRSYLIRYNGCRSRVGKALKMERTTLVMIMKRNNLWSEFPPKEIRYTENLRRYNEACKESKERVPNETL